MSAQGYVKIPRPFTEWEWFTEPYTCHLYMYMYIKANHADGKWRGKEVKRGSLVTSLPSLATATGLSIQQVRTCMKNLKRTEDIEVTTTNKNSLVVLTKYDFWQSCTDESNTQDNIPVNMQDNMQSNRQPTNNQHSSNIQSTTNKNEKNDKNEKNNKKTYKGIVDCYTKNPDLAAALNDFVDMRIKMKGFTAKALELNLKKLDKLAANDETKIAIVNQSIEKSWKGFFELKQAKNDYEGGLPF